MTYPLETQMELIRTGRMVQFSQPVQVPAASLIAGQELEIALPGFCSTFWLPSFIVNPDYSLYVNQPNAQLGIRINLRSAPMLLWGLKPNMVSNFTGPVERIFVTPISGLSGDMIFLAARGIGVGYSAGSTTAGTTGPAPTVTGGGGAS